MKSRDQVLGLRFQGIAAAILVCAALTGCRSAYVDATVHNATGGPVSIVEVDYPSASFGTTTLPDGADFHYRFKILGNGPTKVTWTDSARQDHTSTGPELVEGSEGPLTVTLTLTTAQWNAQVRKIH